MKNIEIQNGKIQFGMENCIHHSKNVSDEEAAAVAKLHYHSTNVKTVQDYFDSLDNGWEYDITHDFLAHGGMVTSYNITRARIKNKGKR